MDLAYLHAPNKTIVAPPIEGTRDELPLEQLGWEDFEKLCLRLVETTYAIHDCEIYGIKGQAQAGIDIFARKGDTLYANYQCKRYQEYPASKIEEVVSEFRRGKWFTRCDEFFLCTTCSLNKTDQQNKFNELRDELSNDGIKFIKWDKVQLSRMLKSHPQIVHDFFGREWVRVFIGEEALSALHETYRSLLTKTSLEEGFRKISLLLESADYAIPGVGFIERAETTELVNWVKSPLQQRKDPIAILEGGAGLGKTAIMRDTLLGLRASSVPVLALKADRIFAPTYAELQKQVSVVSSLDNTVEAIKAFASSEASTVVVLIDQLDALSQSLSTNRKLLTSYRELIQDMVAIPGVRIIISCRTFDLETDPLLQSFKEKSRFKVKLLDEQKVRQAISLSTFSGYYISPKLLDLLRTPLHLRIFCQLDADTNIGRITTLQELYSTLYEQKVLHPDQVSEVTPVNPEQLARLLDEIAISMYEKQQLTAPAVRFQNKFALEVKYALSHNLLSKTGNGKQLQFFHQSFFDYLFARNFVERGESLIELLESAHQGLFIRSAVSQVLTYLRDYDERVYIQQVKQILRATASYRYHIRLLACQQLGQITAPNNAEKHFIEQEVISSPIHRDPFLESVRSRGWAKWLCELGFISELLRRAGELGRSEESLLWFVSLDTTDLALEELKAVELNDVTGHRASSILGSLSLTTELGYEMVFNRFKGWMLKKAAQHYYHILSSRAQLAPEWTAEQLYEVLKDDRHYKPVNWENHQEWELKETVKKLLEHHPEIGFKLVKDLIEHWIDETRYDRFYEESEENESKVFIGDTEFTNHDPREEYCHGLTQEVYDLLHNFLDQASKTDPANTRLLLADWPQSNLSTLIKLSAVAYLANPPAYVGDIIALLTRPNLLMEAEVGRHLNYYLRELIYATYEYFTPAQLTTLHQSILGTLTKLSWFKSSFEGRSPLEPKKYLRTYYGELTYSLLTAIPDITNLPDNHIRKIYKELNRRYGVVKHEIRRKVSWRVGDPSPVTTKQAPCLKATDWLNAFRKHDSSAGARPFHDFEAGLALTFMEQVKAEPLKYRPLLELLLEEPNIDLPATYLERGLEGLSESGENFDRDLLEGLVLEGIDKGKINHKSHRGIRLLRLCVVDGACHERVVEFLADAATTHLRDEHSVTGDSVDELMDGINCIGGMAAETLVHCYEMKSQILLITHTFEQIGADGSAAVRAATLHRLAFLLHLHTTPAPVISLYLKLVGTNYRLIKASEWTLRYLIKHDFTALTPQFKEAVHEQACQETVAKIITLAWTWEKESSYELLQFYWYNSSKSRSASLRYLMDAYPELSDNQKEKARHMFSELLAYNDEDLRNAFSFCFYKLQPKDFPAWLPLLRNYIKAPVSRGREGSFYDYMQSCVQEHPAECIELASSFDSHDKPDVQRNNIEKKPLELLLSAYQVLAEIDSASPLLDLAMDVFDRMLQHSSYRIGAASKLELIDRY